MAPRTVRPLRLASQVSNLLTFFTPTYFTVSRNQLGEATSPIGYHTPNPEEETLILF